MDMTTLGRTGLEVGVAGFGCGGNSRLGLGVGKSDAEAVALVRAAIDLGVNLFDTAENYGTEHVVGEAVEAVDRDSVVISTKTLIRKGGELVSADALVKSLEESLGRLRTDHVDVFFLHAVRPADYDHACEVYLPALLDQKRKGKIRHVGLTESSPNDPDQDMLARACTDDGWEVVMLAFNMMHQAARTRVFPATLERGIGTMLMFVVRNIFSRPGLLSETMKALADEGKVPAELAAGDDTLGFLVHEGGAESLTDAAYRYARHEAGTDVVLFGTSSAAHLKANVESILRPPLPAEDVARLNDLFSHLRGVGLDLPDHVKA